MAMRIKGVQATMSTLSEISRRSTTDARTEIKLGAEEIQKRAQVYAPVDLHNLEKAITVSRPIDTGRQFKVDIRVGGIVNGRNVDEYALIMHEWSGRWGAGTKAKQASLGVLVGPKYLERAARELFPIIQRRVSAALNKIIATKGIFRK